MIALAHGYGPLVFGRLLQGVSGGFIGVVVPLYLAECLSASDRGKGTGIFQWLLTLGIFAAALVGMYFSYRVDEVAKLGDADKLLALRTRHGAASSGCRCHGNSLRDRQLHGGRVTPLAIATPKERRRLLGTASLPQQLAGRPRTQEMQDVIAAEKKGTGGGGAKESLLRRKYVIPFILACIILACNQATGINSIIAYNTNILLQSGLSDIAAHWGYVLFTFVNFAMTYLGVVLVDRKGRKFLLAVGTAGIILSLICTGIIFLGTEKLRIDARSAVQSMVSPDQKVDLLFNQELAGRLLTANGNTPSSPGGPTSLVVIYSYGDFPRGKSGRTLGRSGSETHCDQSRKLCA